MKSTKLLLPMVLLAGLFAAGWFLGPDLVGRVAFAVEKGQHEAARAELAELSKHDHLSVLFRAVAKAVRPAVVEIRVTKRIKIERLPMPDMDEFLKRRFGDDLPFEFKFGPGNPPPRVPREYVRRGLGSGVIVDARNGYVLTNHHVVDGADKVEVVLSDKRKFETEWIRTDPMTDLAIVKIKADRLIDAPLGDSDVVEVGDWVLAIGAPEGLEQTVTAGIISAKGRNTRDPITYQNYLQTDAAINRGNSGGPLVNMRGEVVAINRAIVTASPFGGNEGIGFAISSNVARNVMRQLIDKGKVVRGYLGVEIHDVGEDLAQSMGLPGTDGSLIRQVYEDTPAGKARLKVGDFITAVDGKKITDSDELQSRMAAVSPGTTVKLTLYRGKEKMTVPVEVAEQPKDFAAMRGAPLKEETPSEAVRKFGLEVATLDEDLAKKYGYKRPVEGVVITKVAGASDAAEEGLRVGMIVLQVQGKDVKTAEGFAGMLAAKEAEPGVRLLVKDRRGAQRFVFITPQK